MLSFHDNCHRFRISSIRFISSFIFCFKLRWVEYERARAKRSTWRRHVYVCVCVFAKLANWQNAVLRKVKQIVGTTVFAILSLQIVLCWVTFLLRRKQNHEKLCETEGKLSLIFSSLTLCFASLPYRYSNVKLTNESSNNKRKRKIKSNLYCVFLFLLIPLEPFWGVGRPTNRTNFSAHSIAFWKTICRKISIFLKLSNNVALSH